MNPTRPELCCPAGDWPSFFAAVENGADSVYFGVKGLNMRSLAANFDVLEVQKIMDILRANRKKGYLALNTIAMNKDLDRIEKVLGQARKAGVDAVILWDMAVLAQARELELAVHLSTQASVANYQAFEQYARQGVRRIVMARECTLNDLQDIIREKNARGISCEVEAFIHGAMCISISGRCFLSAYSFGKSANTGECLQPCRREYLIRDQEEEAEYLLGRDYVLSPKDLCALDFLDELIAAGIDAFKIEGRMRSAEYVKVTTAVYRRAIDACLEGRFTPALKEELLQQLRAVYNRGFSRGFYFGRPDDDTSRGLEHGFEKVYLGEVTRFFNKIGVAELRLYNAPLRRGEAVLFVGKKTPALVFSVEEMQQNHVAVQEARKGDSVAVKIPFRVRPHDKVFLWRQKPALGLHAT